ncbi:hypothetical protein PFISCL1PPCAC_7300, partial [Pristionchus fissidentatus]
ARHSTLRAMNLLALLILAITFRNLNSYEFPNSIDPLKPSGQKIVSTSANSNVDKIDSDQLLVELENCLIAFITAPADRSVTLALQASVTVLVDQLNAKG